MSGRLQQADRFDQIGLAGAVRADNNIEILQWQRKTLRPEGQQVLQPKLSYQHVIVLPMLSLQTTVHCCYITMSGRRRAYPAALAMSCRRLKV